MTCDQILEKVIDLTKSGSYYKGENGELTIRTLDGVEILSCNDKTITFYVPIFNVNIATYVTTKKYDDYDVSLLTEDQLSRALELFEKRLKKSNKMYFDYRNVYFKC